MESSLRKLQILVRAEAVLLRLHGRQLTLQLVLIAAGLLLLLFAVALLNLAGYFFLAEWLGQPGAVLSLAGLNAALAVILLTLGTRSRPGPETRLAQEVRDLAWQELSGEVNQVGQGLTALGVGARQVGSALGHFGSRGVDLLQLARLLQLGLRSLVSLFKRNR